MFFETLWKGLFSKPELELKSDKPAPKNPLTGFGEKTYTKEELSDIEQYIRAYPSNALCYTQAKYEYDYKDSPLIVGTIFLNDPNTIRSQHHDNQSNCGHSYNYYRELGIKLVIDLKLNYWEYYHTILEKIKNIKLVKNNITTHYPYVVKELCKVSDKGFTLCAYNYIEFNRHSSPHMLPKLNNFQTKSTAPKYLLNFMTGDWEIEVNQLSQYFSYSDDVDLINQNIEKFYEDLKELEANIVSKYIEKLNSIIDCFPETCYLIEFADNNGKPESMLSTIMPQQDGAGSYRVDNILFRPDYFVLVPAIMYKITVTTFTHQEVLNDARRAINSEFAPELAKYYKGE